MNRKQFFEWMNDPASLDSEGVADLQQLIHDYPYFQTARVLFLLHLKITHDYRFESELKKVAAYATDRSRLKDWIYLLDEAEEKGSLTINEEESLSHSTKNIEEVARLKKLEVQIRENLFEIELKKSKLKELIDEKKALTGEIIHPEEDMAGSQKDSPFRPLPKDEWLEAFIRQRNNQLSKQVGFFNPEESAKKSIEENDGILSETLARLLAAQGKKDKAIEIYQKLMLKNPQKSSYFAAQIEKLRKEP